MIFMAEEILLYLAWCGLFVLTLQLIDLQGALIKRYLGLKTLNQRRKCLTKRKSRVCNHFVLVPNQSWYEIKGYKIGNWLLLMRLNSYSWRLMLLSSKRYITLLKFLIYIFSLNDFIYIIALWIVNPLLFPFSKHLPFIFGEWLHVYIYVYFIFFFLVPIDCLQLSWWCLHRTKTGKGLLLSDTHGQHVFY